MTVTVGNGTPESITSYVWGYGGNPVYYTVPAVVFTVKSDPSGSSTQILTVSMNQSSNTPSDVDFTCTVLEVS